VLAVGLCSTAMAQKQAARCASITATARPACRFHEEGTVGVMLPMMPVFNNLMLFDQHVPQNSMQSIVPELATPAGHGARTAPS